MGAAKHRPAFRVGTPAPDVDDVGVAFVMAAKAAGWTTMAKAWPEGLIEPGRVIWFAWRWLALAALREVWPGCLPELAEKMAQAEGRSQGAAMRHARARPWWTPESVKLIALALRARHVGG